MKKIIFLIVLILSDLVCFAQINILQTNNLERDPNEIFINGISTREDIGGVDCQITKATITKEVFVGYNTSVPRGQKGFDIYEPRNFDIVKSLVFTNYNTTPVTVLFSYRIRDKNKTGNIVLPPANGSNYPSKIFTISTDNNIVFSEEFNDLITIVRKVGN